MKKSIFYYALSSLLLGGMALSVASCADDDITPNQGNDGDALVRFSINDVQEQTVGRGLEMTRGAIASNITTADLTGHKLAAHGNIDICLIETTVEGVNPIKVDASTRANIKTAIDGDFSSTGIRGNAANNILTSPEWFHAAKTNSNGELYTPIKWSWSIPHARFFAIYPEASTYSKMKIGNTASTGSPSVEFEIEPDVKKEVDLMTACTGYVHYATQGVHPTTNLDFRHALTGIRFAVGQNLSWNKIIDKVELRNVLMKSKYVLSKELDGTGATWDHTGYSMRGNATLSGISVSTSNNPNVTIMGNAGDNFTFYMIPQVLTGKNVKVYIHFTDNTSIEVDLKGEWKAGTTRTYKLSQKKSNWTYVLTSTSPVNPVAYNKTTSDPYTVTSYRESNGKKQAVAWKVVGYSVDNGAHWSTTKPAWLTSLSKESGVGGTAAEAGVATLTTDFTNLLEKRNNVLKEATPLGNAGSYYDLSTNGGSTSRSTANCYVISAPGHYRIPLVYGNAIKNGNDNPSSYNSSVNGYRILERFKDHADNDINNPWIEKTNSGANAGINGAEIVWADEANLIHLASGSAAIVHDAGNAFLQFEVKAADIKSGNAVVAVKKGNTIVWSWHLWFAPKGVLSTIPVTNYQNKIYNFTSETVGWKPTSWNGTTYEGPRSVKIRVEQTVANNGTKQFSDITITQTAHHVRTGYATLYQAGRKDALPGTNDISQGSYSYDNTEGGRSLGYAIQHPNNMLSHANRPQNLWSWCEIPYINLWSADSKATTPNDIAVVKTIYDPSPAGFKLPSGNAFTGFTIDGQSGNIAKMNVNGTQIRKVFTDNFGHNFWTNKSKTATIFFPATGVRGLGTGSFGFVGARSYYWTASSGGQAFYTLYSDWERVHPLFDNRSANAGPIRPVSE